MTTVSKHGNVSMFSFSHDKNPDAVCRELLQNILIIYRGIQRYTDQATKTPQMSSIVSNKRNSQKNRWFLSPTQLPSHGQWWSNLWTHRSHN